MTLKLGQQILWLSEKDVQGLLNMKETLKAVENVFLLQGKNKVQLPSKIYLDFEPFGGDLRAMPAYVKSTPPAAGVKIVNSNALNPAKGLPAVSGIMVFNDPKTGLPLGVFAAGNLTSMRTGAAGGIAAKFLARPDSSTVGLIGCGKQAATQLEALSLLFKLKKVLVWGVTLKESTAFSALMKKKFSLDFIPCENVEQACDADILVTTTPVHKPIVKKEWVRPGTHINAIGADAPGKQELETSLLLKAKVVVDEWGQSSHAGEINVAVHQGKFKRNNIAAQLGEIVAGKKKGRTHKNDITIFDSTGLAIQDVATALVLYHKALKLKKGKVLQFHG